MSETRSTRRFSLFLICMGALVLPRHACAVERQGPAGPEPDVAGPAAPSIRLVWHLTPEERLRSERAAREDERASREAERRRIAALRPQLAAWSRRYEPALRLLRAALADAIAHLSRGRGPESQTVCIPVADALPGLAALRPAPDPLLDRHFAAALTALHAGAEACVRGLPATGLRLLQVGQRRQEETDRMLDRYLQTADETPAPERVRPPGWGGRTGPG